ncbi:phenylalanine--tRNA ligase subunit alpha [Gemelliphila palaticanis]|uniref:Phenylalanine--tRNA ligase alpha subunit n=1 Tax=Gemelliphila palaticanis TaxID=81950 RepID=A0ABX2SZN7_9BACL|nr:phenylalanine--tRNA ligase subunit alpha [Gemella palaticanis]MBF0714882.1 phenylalanine--tRNA ligase subunit alpha [Gemella palaticanis]NYS46812.1 phenylalanine--tRNA ligase subunit alpha [Gemella palaticanis]
MTLENIKKEYIEKVKSVVDEKELYELRVKFLGKKGKLTEIMKEAKNLSPEERPAFGKTINEIKNYINDHIEETKQILINKAIEAKLSKETIDVTLPSKKVTLGGMNPLNKVIEEIEELFISMGYSVAEGPEVETDKFNFEMLNLPKDHPARDMQDSFYITEELLMRTQTSPVQAREMLKAQGRGPIKIICPGKVFRRDNDDATHSHQFTQIEGLVVDKNITFSDLKGTLEYLIKSLFGENKKIRLRPSFFPFTEPSVEVDISWGNEDDEENIKWLEILGAGMVHPNVLKMAGFDPEEYSGFAFGMGPERIAMLKYGISDIRSFYTNDVRFLEQFNNDRND